MWSKIIRGKEMIPIAKPFIAEEEKKAVMEVLNSGMIAQGPKVSETEKYLAQFCGTKDAVLFNSGTAALHTAMHIAGIRKGDEVITTPFTFIATANTILMNGAKPVFADIDSKTFNISPESVKEKITDKTKAILCVDIYGQLCDYDAIRKIARDNDLLIIEDACQAIGASFEGKMAGSFGDVGCFSFYATKNVTCGEGGGMVTDNLIWAEKAKLFRQHGMTSPGAYDYDEIGYNYRTTDINAAILLGQLKRADDINQKRIDNAAYFNENLKEIDGIKTPFVANGSKHVYHEYTIKVENFKLTRDQLLKHLKDNDVGAAIYYPKPLHILKSYSYLGYKEGDLPVTEKINSEVLSLPVHPKLTKEELQKIVDVIKNA